MLYLLGKVIFPEEIFVIKFAIAVDALRLFAVTITVLPVACSLGVVVLAKCTIGFAREIPADACECLGITPVAALTSTVISMRVFLCSVLFAACLFEECYGCV